MALLIPRVKRIALALILGVVLLPGVALADDVLAGHDLFETPAEAGSFQSFEDLSPGGPNCTLPGFLFDAGCEDFSGTAFFEGVPLDSFEGFTGLGQTDTIVRRLEDASLPAIGSNDTVPIEIVALNLRSVDPITVTCPGVDQLWDIAVTLSPIQQPTGSMTITHEIAAGGTFSSTLPVNPLLTFTRVSDGETVPVDLAAAKPECALEFDAVGRWSHEADPDVIVQVDGLTSNFVPGHDPGLPDFPARECPVDPRKDLTVEQAVLALHGICPANPKDGDRTTDVELVEINKGQPKRAVECAAPGPNNEVHFGNGRALAHDPDHNHLFYTECAGGCPSPPQDIIFKVDPSNAQPQGGIPQVCELIDQCQVVFPDGTPMFIGAMAYQDRNDFDPPADFDILWLAPYDGAGFGGVCDIWQLAIDTDAKDQFAPQRRPDGTCEPTFITNAPCGRGPQCPLPQPDGFPDGLEFDPSPDIPGAFSIWISDDLSDLVQRLIFPEDPTLSFKREFQPQIDEHRIHKCNTGIAVDPTGGPNPVWLIEHALDFRPQFLNVEDSYLSQRPRASLDPRVFEAAAYDMGLFGVDPRDLSVKNARGWEDAEFDETLAFQQFGHRCGVWTVDDATTILRSGTNIGSNELQLIRFDVPCGQDEIERLAVSERLPISLTKKIHNNGPIDPAVVHSWDFVDAPAGCDVSYHTQEDEELIIADGVPFFELQDDGTLEPLGVGPASLVPGPSHTIVTEGTAGVAVELEVHSRLPGEVPVSIPVNFHEEFDKHCAERGTKIFEFCVQVMPAPPIEDLDPTNNRRCVTEVVEVDGVCEPRSKGFWKHQCSDKGHHQVPRDELEALFLDVEAQSGVFPECAPNASCAVLEEDGPQNDMRVKAERQFLALQLNLASSRLSLSCPANRGTLADVIAEVEAILCDPLASKDELERAYTLAEAVNVGGEDAEVDNGNQSDLVGQPGETLRVSLALINMSGWTEAYELTAAGQWIRETDTYPFTESLPMTASLSTTSLPRVKAGQVVTLTLEMTVPNAALAGEVGSVLVTATDLDSAAGLQRTLTLNVTAQSDGGGGMKEDDEIGLIKGKQKP